MKENKLIELSVDFAIKALKLCNEIKGHASLRNQFERSATSIGANIHEANYAQGRNDFISKLQISLKECYETEFWLELFARSGIADAEAIKKLQNESGTIRRMLIASINTTKKNGG